MSGNNVIVTDRWYHTSVWPAIYSSKKSRSAGSAQMVPSGNVTPLSRARVRERETESEHLGLVGIITNGFESTYFGRMVEQASNYFISKGFHAIVQSNSKTREGELTAWESLKACRCDGFIVHSDRLSDDELSELLSQHPQAVLMNRYIAEFSERCIYFDNVMGGRLAAEHLLAHGHTNMAVVTGHSYFFEVKERTTGFINAVRQHNPALNPTIIESDFQSSGGANAMKQIIDSGDGVTAVFFQNDDMALGALEYCEKIRIDVPGDISIVGFDDLQSGKFSSPALTTVHQPLNQIGHRAAALLYKMMTDEPAVAGVVPESNFFTPVLVPRKSVASPTTRKCNPVLTRRESECLGWTALGKTSWEMSVILGISESTATFHLRNAGSKLRANNRSHAVATALKLGLIES